MAGEPKMAGSWVRGLSNREATVLRYVAAGHSNKLIAAELRLSLESVATYIRRARSKLGVSSRTALIRIVANSGHNAGFDVLPSRGPPLTAVEQEVAQGLLLGLSYRQIAQHRQTSPRTIATQTRGLFAKLGISSRHDLAAWAFGIGRHDRDDREESR
jgi:DNA-binding CsgD family transcriptional regulator